MVDGGDPFDLKFFGQPAPLRWLPAEPRRHAIDLVVIFALLTFIGNDKNARKNKTNTDSTNSTDNHNPEPTIDKAPKRN